MTGILPSERIESIASDVDSNGAGIAYTLELRDDGQFGLLLPDDQVQNALGIRTQPRHGNSAETDRNPSTCFRPCVLWLIIPNAEEMVPAMYEYGLSVLQAFAGAEARRANATATSPN